MTKFPAILAASLALSCASDPETTDPSLDELSDGLVDTGKADARTSEVTVTPFSVALRGSAARTLYNGMHDAGAPAHTAAGFRILRGPRTACITDGEATFCLLIGNSSLVDSDAFEATIGGRAAEFVSGLGIQTWFACEASDSQTSCNVERSELVTLEFEGMEDLGDDFVYEGWAVTGAFGAATTSRFADPSGAIFQRLPNSVASLDVTYVLTIEPRRGDDSGPAATHILAGALAAGTATTLDTQHPAALGTSFEDAGGSFLLATPSTAAGSDDSQGIWFLDPASGEASLSLPKLPDGWVYEGWAVGANGPISTGRFVDANGADSDGGGPAAGPDATPPFPGQDFINPPFDLIGATIVVSVEPEPDNSDAPFSIKPLVDVNVEDVAAPATQALVLTNANRAHGRALLGRGELANAGQIWTADRVDGTVSIIEVATDRAIANLVLGSIEPMYVNYSGVADRVFVGDRKNNRVVAIDPGTRAVTDEIAVGAGVFHQWVGASGWQLWVNNDVDRTTSVIDVRNGKVLATIPMPADLASMAGTPKPHDVFVSPTQEAAFVTYLGFEGDSDVVVRFDATTFEETHRASVGSDPHVFATAAGSQIFVAAQGSSEVSFFERSNLGLSSVVSVPGAHGITGANDGRLYAANTPGGGVEALFAIDASSATRLNSQGVSATPEGNPHNITLEQSGTRLFVTHSGATSRLVSVYSVSEQAPVPVFSSSIRVGGNPFGLGFVPARR